MEMDARDVFPELPPESVVSDPAAIDALYRRNVTALDRDIPLVVRPAGEGEVRYAVARANARGIRLYPLSTGKKGASGRNFPSATDVSSSTCPGWTVSWRSARPPGTR